MAGEPCCSRRAKGPWSFREGRVIRVHSPLLKAPLTTARKHQDQTGHSAGLQPCGHLGIRVLQRSSCHVLGVNHTVWLCNVSCGTESTSRAASNFAVLRFRTGPSLRNVHFRSSEEAVETLRLATEAACLGIFDWNLEDGELHWSELAKEMYGVRVEGHLTLADFAERIHPEDRERVLAAVRQTLDPASPGEYDLEYRIVRPNGEERSIAAKGKAFFEEMDGGRKATRFLGTLLDRTEQKLAQAALIQAEHLAATGRLAASIAHEINNPLEAVTNLLYLIRHEREEDARNAYLLTAESELARVSEIASNTLRFYRDPKGQSRVGLTPLLQSVVGLYQGRLAVRRIEVDMKCEEGAEVTASQGELRQVLVNLIGNALDAMPKGGRLRIQSRTFAHGFGDLQPGAGVFIADTGVGMSPALLERVFEPFYTTKGAAGTGLGLWLSREIVKKHGFKLLVKSRPEKGTVFGIYMPETVRSA